MGAIPLRRAPLPLSGEELREIVRSSAALRRGAPRNCPILSPSFHVYAPPGTRVVVPRARPASQRRLSPGSGLHIAPPRRTGRSGLLPRFRAR
jgi:hypothetical protein